MHERLNEVLPKGGRTVFHMHPFDQIYFVRGGSLSLAYSYEKMEVGANSLVILPKGMPHTNENNGTDTQHLITLLLPAPAKGTSLGVTAPWMNNNVSSSATTAPPAQQGAAGRQGGQGGQGRPAGQGGQGQGGPARPDAQ